jgi:hypothetical protein
MKPRNACAVPKPDCRIIIRGASFCSARWPGFTEHERHEVVHAHPYGAHVEIGIDDAFAHCASHKSEPTFGNVKAEVRALKDPHYHRENLCTMIPGSACKD